MDQWVSVGGWCAYQLVLRSFRYDKSQDIAKAYHARCKTEFSPYDERRAANDLGKFADGQPSQHIPVTGSDPQAAVDILLEWDSP